MRSDVEIARLVADGGAVLSLSHAEIERALDLRILTEHGDYCDDQAAAERWLTAMGAQSCFELAPEALSKSNPAHYQREGIEPIDVIEAWALDFRLANAIKYIARAGRKPGQSRDDDLRKAADYLHRARFGRWPWQESDRG